MKKNIYILVFFISSVYSDPSFYSIEKSNTSITNAKAKDDHYLDFSLYFGKIILTFAGIAYISKLVKSINFPKKDFSKINTSKLSAREIPLIKKNNDQTFFQNTDLLFQNKETDTLPLNQVFIDENLKELLLSYARSVLFDQRKTTISNIFCLYGLPGMCKTDIIKGIANELNVPLIIVDPMNLSNEGNFTIHSFVNSTCDQRPIIIHVKNIENMPNNFFNSREFNKFISNKNSYKNILFTFSCNSDFFIKHFSIHKNLNIEFFLIDSPSVFDIENIVTHFLNTRNISYNFDIKSISKILHRCTNKDIYLICQQAYSRKVMKKSDTQIILEAKDIVEELKNLRNNDIIIDGTDDPYKKKLNTGLQVKDSLFFSAEESRNDVTFDNIIGSDYIKKELIFFQDYLQNPKEYQRLGLKIPKGILFVGPPGCGKTLMARALAGEAKVKYISINGASFMDKYVGSGAKKIREVFELAKMNTPCIIFIDEIDSIASRRGNSSDSAQKDFTNAVNELLVQMDGFDKDYSGIIVIGSTNRIDILDPAILRRFEPQYSFDLPNFNSRKNIITYYLKNDLLDRSVLIDSIASKTDGFSPSDLENLVNYARYNAYKKIVEQDNKKDNQKIDKIVITQNDFTDAYNRAVLGIEIDNHDISEKALYKTAIHEIGHSLCILLQEDFPLEFDLVTIKPLSHSGGTILGHASWYLKKEFQYKPFNKKELLQSIIVAYGGMIAEELIMGTYTEGVVSDFQHASQIALHMVLDIGMSGELLLSGKKEINEMNDQERIAVETILKDAKEQCFQILSNNKTLLLHLATVLMEKKTILKEEIIEIINNFKISNKSNV